MHRTTFPVALSVVNSSHLHHCGLFSKMYYGLEPHNDNSLMPLTAEIHLKNNHSSVSGLNKHIYVFKNLWNALGKVQL